MHPTAYPKSQKNFLGLAHNTLDSASSVHYNNYVQRNGFFDSIFSHWSWMERICRSPRQMAKKPGADRSRILDRFEGPKAESEITMKKLGPKNAKTTTQVEKRAGVLSLRNMIFGIPAAGPRFSRRIVWPNPPGFHLILGRSISERKFSMFFENRKIAPANLLPIECRPRSNRHPPSREPSGRGVIRQQFTNSTVPGIKPPIGSVYNRMWPKCWAPNKLNGT